MAIQDYVPTDWVDGTAPAINALNLNHIEQGIDNATTAITNIEDKIGDGTTLDADTLDGHDSSYFCTAATCSSKPTGSWSFNGTTLFIVIP